MQRPLVHRAATHRRWLPTLLAVVSCPGPLSGQEVPLSPLAVADEIVAFRDSAPEVPDFVPLRAASDATLDRWREALFGSENATDPLLRDLLVEMIDQGRAMRSCPAVRETSDEAVGATCYAGLVRVMTGLDLTPGDVHDIGVEMRLDVEARIAALAEPHLGVSTSVEARRLLTEGEAYRFPSREAMREEASLYLARARAAMPRIVHVVPDDPLELVVVPEEQGATIAAAAWYNRAGEDRPARFFLNTTQADARPRAVAATAAFHEGWPGHHFQAARHAGLAARHPATHGLAVTAYVEGWGLYAELLADELGLYPTVEDRIGYLLHLQDAMVALQVDAGLHAFGWSREQAVDTMVVVGGRPARPGRAVCGPPPRDARADGLVPDRFFGSSFACATRPHTHSAPPSTCGTTTKRSWRTAPCRSAFSADSWRSACARDEAAGAPRPATRRRVTADGEAASRGPQRRCRRGPRRRRRREERRHGAHDGEDEACRPEQERAGGGEAADRGAQEPT